MQVIKAPVPDDVHRQVKAFAALHGTNIPDAYRSLITLAINGASEEKG